MVIRYIVVDIRTGYTVRGPFADRRRARRCADRLDLAYGAIRYTVREIAERTIR